jgi:hypothetical protein
MRPSYINTTDVVDQRLRFRALTWSLMRFVVEKHGGHMTVNPETDSPSIAVPDTTEDACLHELETLLDYARS